MKVILKKYLINLLTLIISVTVLFFILNWVLLFEINQSNFIFSKFDQNRMTKLQKVFFPDIYTDFKKNYVLFIGDSYAYGAGDSYLNGDYDYGIAHQYFNKSGTSVFNSAVPGNDSPKSIKHAFVLYDLINNSIFLKNKINDPDKIFFFFYEGNDIVHNGRPRYEKFFNNPNKCKNIYGDKLSVNDVFFESNFYFVKFFYYNIRHQLNLKVQKGNLVSFLKIILPKNTYSKLESKYDVEDIKIDRFNEIRFSNTTSHLTGTLQFPPIELDNDQISLSFEILDNSLKCLNSKFLDQEKYFIYIPSPVTFYDFSEETLFLQSDFDDNKYFLKSISELKKLSHDFEFKATEVASRNNLKIISIRNNLLNLSKNKLIHGSNDIHHFNKMVIMRLLIQ